MAIGLSQSVSSAISALETSPVGEMMRSSPALYPAVNIAHLAGLVLLVGAIGILDLRILGFGRRIPLGPLARLLTPLAAAGLAIGVASGALLFAADAGPLSQSGVFQAKMALAATGVVNAALHRRWFGRDLREPPLRSRLMALLSIGLWLTVAALGRLIAYS